MASRPSAASATVLATTPLVDRPAQSSPNSGPLEIRPRDGLSPTMPQQEAGIRIEPPPSPPCPSAQRLAATAAAAPPLEPPAVRLLSMGFRAGGNIGPSVTGRVPNSGAFVFPRMTALSYFKRTKAKLSTWAMDFSNTSEARLLR